MQARTSMSAPKINFESIDTIRFISISLIVWGHCSTEMSTLHFSNMSAVLLQSFIIQIGKLGTVIFFLIAGFLMQPKIASYTPLEFLKFRLKPTILPWLYFVVVIDLLHLYEQGLLGTLITEGKLAEGFILFLKTFKDIISYLAYWFIVVFLISSLILIVFRKYINSIWMGVVLGIITLLYCINLYFGWISAHHTKAFLAYIFFMWAGIQVRKHYGTFTLFIHRIAWWKFLAAFLISFLLASFEGRLLAKLHCVDPYASIRLSNIINSLIVFMCLYKIGPIAVINGLKPRRHVYGIYLIHSILLLIRDGIISRSEYSRPHHMLGYMAIEVRDFIIVLGLSLAMVAAFRALQSIQYLAQVTPKEVA
ncbi:MAG: acyltransferase [Bacteroidota bacterium]